MYELKCNFIKSTYVLRMFITKSILVLICMYSIDLK